MKALVVHEDMLLASGMAAKSFLASLNGSGERLNGHRSLTGRATMAKEGNSPSDFNDGRLLNKRRELHNLFTHIRSPDWPSNRQHASGATTSVRFKGLNAAVCRTANSTRRGIPVA